MRVAIIGAGASGLTAAGALLDVGVTPVVFEQSEEIGGLWVYRPDGPGPAYRSLRTNTSKQITAFSDEPFSGELPDFPSREAVHDYLCAYAARRDLPRLINRSCGVRSLVPAEQGRWRLVVSDGRTETADEFDAAVVCSGIFSMPVMPSIPGLRDFAGHILHSIEYRVPDPFAGKRVLVVGLGSSAADIAVDLVGRARSVTLSTRRGAWVAPRMVNGWPLDHRGTRLSLLLPAPLRARRRQRLLLQEYTRRGFSTPASLWDRAHVPFSPASAPSVTSDDLLPRLMAGEIDARPGIVRVDGPDVVFADGGRVQPDSVIFCTGYGLAFPFLPSRLQPWTDAASGLYRLVFSPDHQSLAFIGVCRVHGPILPIVEMQARWMARVLTGDIKLPPAAVMRGEIERRWNLQTARQDSPIRVALLPYLDEIGALIGVRPHVWRHPRLLLPLLAGPPVAAQYRLEGPDPWSGAAQVIRNGGRPAPVDGSRLPS